MEAPAPECPPGGVIVSNRASLISLGTERSVIELGRKSLVGKARARPDLVKRAFEKARRDGLWRTYQEAMGRLDTPTSLGYSCAGDVVEAGALAHEFGPGDRVACIGQGFASHADYVSVPVNLAAKIPPGVSYENAAFGMLGVIALHGVRSARIDFGARVAVIGLGLLGLITVQLLRAYGCQVVCMDLEPEKAALARACGADIAVSTSEALFSGAEALSAGYGCDAAIITASTRSAGPVDDAIRVCRQRGRIVIVGVADIHPDRNELWRKEIELVVSKAGGPGSLDPIYELGGIDLPIGDVRWTERRNLEEFLRLVADGRLQLGPLVTHRFDIDEAVKVYGQLSNDRLGQAIGVVLKYPGVQPASHKAPVPGSRHTRVAGAPRLGVIGAGLFAKSVLLPTLRQVRGVSLEVLAAASGSSAAYSARRFGFKAAATGSSTVLEDPNLDGVIAALPHEQHARIVMQALALDKPLLIEKPLCIEPSELAEITATLDSLPKSPRIMVGHNRRYSPHTQRLRLWLSSRRSPLVMTIRVNAGFVPKDHWVHSENQGRSRIVGEMTHFLDLIIAIAGSRITRIEAVRIAGDDRTTINNDNVGVLAALADGSIATLAYSAQGARGAPRETIEVMSEGATLTCTDFTVSTRVRPSGRRETYRTAGARAGYIEELRGFVDVVAGVAPMVPPFADAIHVMKAAFAIEQALATGAPVLLASA